MVVRDRARSLGETSLMNYRAPVGPLEVSSGYDRMPSLAAGSTMKPRT